MSARAALGRAFLATGGSIIGLGAATFVVSSVSMGVAKAVIHERKVCLERANTLQALLKVPANYMQTL